MKTLARCLFVGAIAVLMLCICLPVLAQVPQGWRKITGLPQYYSGAPDGIMPDVMPNGALTDGRQNSYAWSMECMDGYLYVGTSRNVLGPMLLALGIPLNEWPAEFPYPTDMRGRIFRMKISTGIWSSLYLCDPVYVQGQPILGQDLGYRMMKTYAGGAAPVLYVGGSGLNYCRMLAIERSGRVTPVFSTAVGGAQKLSSIRAITVHNNQLCWASEDMNGMAIWCSKDPLTQFKRNPAVQFERIGVPSDWFANGAEIWDMVSYNGWLYVFFANHDANNLGFWCAKTKKANGVWSWRVIVGDKVKGAKYLPGMGKTSNGAGVPVLFGGKVYVGTMDATAIRMTSEMGSGGPPPGMDAFSNISGMQIFRFDTSDKWERAMPPADATSLEESMLNGFINPMNVYIWRFGVQGNRLYAGTFDARTMLESIGPLVGIPRIPLLNPAGFDLYSTVDGNNWRLETITGFGDRWNYGARTFASDPTTGDLYLGTANPFYGCQVWKKPVR